jgi:acylphosphatase
VGFFAPDTIFRKVSPKPIDMASRHGVRRNAFQLHATAAFRQAAVVEAQRLGLRGFLTTHDEHSVQGMAEGSAMSLDAFFDWCLGHGPAGEIPAVIDVTDEDDRALGVFCDVDPTD